MLAKGSSKLQVFDSASDALERFVRILNDGVNETPISEQTLSVLRELIRDWFAFGKNATRLFAERPILKQVGFLTFVMPTESSEVRVVHTPNTESNDPEALAHGLFLNFLMNPNNASLRGKCACCKRYFINNTRRRVVRFCKKECGRQLTSKLANQKSRKDEWDDKFKRVKEAIQKLPSRNTGESWKETVSSRTGISKNWITRALKKKHISQPIRTAAGHRYDRLWKGNIDVTR